MAAQRQFGDWLLEDGDTILNTKSGERVRVQGYDAPEVPHPQHGKPYGEVGGEAATNALAAQLSQPGWGLRKNALSDPYGRTVGQLTNAQGEDVARPMIQDLHAAPTQHSLADPARQWDMAVAGAKIANDPTDPDVQRLNATPTMDVPPIDLPKVRPPTGLWPTVRESILRGEEGMKAGSGGLRYLSGLATGDEELAQAGEKQAFFHSAMAAAHPAAVPNYEDINRGGGVLDTLGRVGKFGIESLGEQVPVMGRLLGAGAAGTMAGGPVGGVVAGALEAGLMNLGETAATASAHGIRDVGDITGTGVGKAALDVAGLALPGSMIAKSLGRKTLLKEGSTALGRIGQTMGAGAAGEMPTEGAQEYLDIEMLKRGDPTFQITPAEELNQILNAGLKAAIPGAATGGAGASLAEAYKATRPEQPGAEQPAPAVGPQPIEATPQAQRAQRVNDLASAVRQRGEGAIEGGIPLTGDNAVPIDEGIAASDPRQVKTNRVRSIVTSYLQGIQLELPDIVVDDPTPAGKESPKYGGRYHSGTRTIQISDAIMRALDSPDPLMQARAHETIAHETGHFISREVYDALPMDDSNRLAIDADFAKWRDDQANKPLIEAFMSRRSAASAAMEQERINAYGTELAEQALRDNRGERTEEYVFSQSEWMADQAARYLTNPESIKGYSFETQSIIQKLAAFFQELFTRSTVNLEVAPSMQKFLDGLKLDQGQASFTSEAPLSEGFAMGDLNEAPMVDEYGNPVEASSTPFLGEPDGQRQAETQAPSLLNESGRKPLTTEEQIQRKQGLLRTIQQSMQDRGESGPDAEAAVGAKVRQMNSLSAEIQKLRKSLLNPQKGANNGQVQSTTAQVQGQAPVEGAPVRQGGRKDLRKEGRQAAPANDALNQPGVGRGNAARGNAANAPASVTPGAATFDDINDLEPDAPHRPRRIISGGQSGADIAGLSIARELGIETGGHAPRGWITSAGSQQEILSGYGLEEDTDVPEGAGAGDRYRSRTIKNAHNADATIAIATNFDSPGERLTAQAARGANKPFLQIDPRDPEAVQKLQTFLNTHKPGTLNVAGNSDKTSPGIKDLVKDVLRRALSQEPTAEAKPESILSLERDRRSLGEYTPPAPDQGYQGPAYNPINSAAKTEKTVRSLYTQHEGLKPADAHVAALRDAQQAAVDAVKDGYTQEQAIGYGTRTYENARDEYRRSTMSRRDAEEVSGEIANRAYAKARGEGKTIEEATAVADAAFHERMALHLKPIRNPNVQEIVKATNPLTPSTQEGIDQRLENAKTEDQEGGGSEMQGVESKYQIEQTLYVDHRGRTLPKDEGLPAKALFVADRRGGKRAGRPGEPAMRRLVQLAHYGHEAGNVLKGKVEFANERDGAPYFTVTAANGDKEVYRVVGNDKGDYVAEPVNPTTLRPDFEDVNYALTKATEDGKYAIELRGTGASMEAMPGELSPQLIHSHIKQNIERANNIDPKSEDYAKEVIEVRGKRFHTPSIVALGRANSEFKGSDPRDTSRAYQVGASMIVDRMGWRDPGPGEHGPRALDAFFANPNIVLGNTRLKKSGQLTWGNAKTLSRGEIDDTDLINESEEAAQILSTDDPVAEVRKRVADIEAKRTAVANQMRTTKKGDKARFKALFRQRRELLEQKIRMLHNIDEHGELNEESLADLHRHLGERGLGAAQDQLGEILTQHGVDLAERDRMALATTVPIRGGLRRIGPTKKHLLGWKAHELRPEMFPFGPREEGDSVLTGDSITIDPGGMIPVDLPGPIETSDVATQRALIKKYEGYRKTGEPERVRGPDMTQEESRDLLRRTKVEQLAPTDLRRRELTRNPAYPAKPLYQAGVEPMIKDTDVAGEQTYLVNQTEVEREERAKADEYRTAKLNQKDQKSRTKPAEQQVQPIPGSTSITQAERNFVERFLQQIGYRSWFQQLGSKGQAESPTTNLFLYDEGGIDTVRRSVEKKLAGLKAQRTEGLPEKTRRELDRQINQRQQQLDALKAVDPKAGSAFVALDNMDSMADNRQLIFLSKSLSPTARARHLSLELGRMMHRNVIEQLVRQTKEFNTRDATAAERLQQESRKDALRQLFGLAEGETWWGLTPDQRWLAEERFAEMTYRWALNKPAVRNNLDQVYQGAASALQATYDAAKAGVQEKQFEAFDEWMRKVLHRTDVKPKTPLGRAIDQALSGRVIPAHPLSRSGPKTAVAEGPGYAAADGWEWDLVDFDDQGMIAGKLRQLKASQPAKMLMDTIKALSPIWQNVDKQFRAMGGEDGVWIGRQINRQPGDEHSGPTLEELIRQRHGWIETDPDTYSKMTRGKIQPRNGLGLSRILRQFGDLAPNLREAAENYLFHRSDITKAEYAALEQRVGVNEARLVRDAVWQLRDFYDRLADKLTGKPERNGFIPRGEWGLAFERSRNYAPSMLDIRKWDLNPDEVKAILKKARPQWSDEVVNGVYRLTSATDGELFRLHDLGDLGQTLFGEWIIPPSFKSYLKYKFDDDIRNALWDGGFYVKDQILLARRYTHAAVKRSAFDTKFGDYVDVWNEETQEWDEKWDPAGKIQKLQAQSFQRKDGLGFTRFDIHRQREVLFPALLGRLGAYSLPMPVRLLQNVALTGFNAALLPLMLLSQVVEIGQTDMRAGKFGSTIRKSLQLWKDREGLHKIRHLAHLIGSIRDDLTESVISSAAEMEYTMPLVQKANNKLFKWFGANVWTKNIRTVAVAIAKDTLVHYAETNNLKALKQLGMGDDAVARVLEWSSKNDWYDRASQGGGYSDVATALNEWVDTAIVRPNSALRTAWGNDHRMAMMWYLHDFLWGFQAKILDRVIHQARMSKGIPAQAMPFLMLGAFLLPWSALGYELRWMLTQPGAAALTGGTVQTPHKQGFDYFSDVVNRSGMLGIFGLVQESYEAVERNDNPFVPLLGAPIDKTLDWLTKDTEYMMAHTLPPMSLSSVVRKEVRGTDAWQWLFDKGQYADD